ncbi:hypothetical protein TrLO_g7729 [Triparma laevis f. longispina]|uniref:WW domain-containing protein n=1 Tax=Triparma laevis f. longispina TaxID=1714387 RepID=A0A9W7EHE7_9STRA|nr:hypothetical protein TrLO_g7729 [Triparma laevis f. longispina]
MLRGLIETPQNATLYDQSGSLSVYFTCYDHGDWKYCLATYSSLGLLILASFIFGGACCLRLFSKEERQARADKKLAKVQSKSIEIKSASTTSGRTGKNNPMSDASKTTKKKPLPPGWNRAQDEKGNVYFVNQEKNITQWTNPNAG